MGIGFSSELRGLRNENGRHIRNKDAQEHRVHQHQLDRKRDRGKISNTIELLGDPLVRPFIQTVSEFLHEHTKHVKATRERREKRFKEGRGIINAPQPGGKSSPRILPYHGDGPENLIDLSPNPILHRGPGRRHHHPGRSPPHHYDHGNDDDGYDDDDDYGDDAGGMHLPTHHRPHRPPRRRLHPTYDRTPPHRPSRRPKPRDPGLDPRDMMHGGLGPGDEPFPPPQRQPRGPRRHRGGYYPYGGDFGGRAQGLRPERGGGGGSGSGSGFEDAGWGSGSRSGTGMGGGSHVGSEDMYAGRRGMPPRRGMRRGGGSQ
ncbi:MAG: hypothetical protein FRX48_01991 [Lasallia pustulata]|uniref:Uncharacterized protein n=1 Tax=Lasallia pustulata TaxID=136370 RepID=A0A5M8PW30_9LECA|nr:MAG: hypothetical protein FRX48_01991 [Lasallia pustulata]